MEVQLQVVEQPSGTCSVADALEPGRAAEETWPKSSALWVTGPKSSALFLMGTKSSALSQ